MISPSLLSESFTVEGRHTKESSPGSRYLKAGTPKQVLLLDPLFSWLPRRARVGG